MCKIGILHIFSVKSDMIQCLTLIIITFKDNSTWVTFRHSHMFGFLWYYICVVSYNYKESYIVLSHKMRHSGSSHYYNSSYYNTYWTNPAHFPPKSVPTIELYIVLMDWKSNSTPTKVKNNLCSSSRIKVMLRLLFSVVLWAKFFGRPAGQQAADKVVPVAIQPNICLFE